MKFSRKTCSIDVAGGAECFTLESARLVVTALRAGGRIVSVIDRASGTEFVRATGAIEGASGDPAGLAELVKAAVAEAQATATAAAAEKMTELTGGLDIPGLDGMLP